jgi:hypothetical protein
MDNTDFGTLKVMCYECSEGHFWDQAQAARCVVIPEKRAISGWGRDCAECGKGNAWSSAEINCISCRYEASKCSSSPCCNPDEDLGCNEHFELVDGKCICKRGDNFKINGDCWCLEDLTYVAYENEEIVCKQCVNKCPIGCSDFTCPDGTYLDKDNSDPTEQCKCKPVHYSCATGSGPLETDCITCNKDDGFIGVTVKGQFYCYCECCLIEADKTCVHISPESDYTSCRAGNPSETSVNDDDTTVKCPTGTTYNGVKCVTIVCDPGYVLVGDTCTRIICDPGYKLIGDTCFKIVCDPGYELVDNRCVEIVCGTGFKLVGDTCEEIVCETGSNLVGDTCVPIVCETGYELIGNICNEIVCDIGFELIGSTCKPIICTGGSILVGNTCECRAGFYWNLGVKMCVTAPVCPTGTVMIQGYCVEAPN